MIRQLVLYILCLQIIGASILFGAIHPWALSLITITTLINFLLFWYDKMRSGTPLAIPKHLLIILLVFSAFLLFHLFYTVETKVIVDAPLKDALHEMNQKNLTVVTPLSVYDAKLALYQWLACILNFIIVFYVLKSRRDLLVLLGTIVIICSLQGIYGIVQFLKTADPLPFFDSGRQQKITGTYLNRNTYACFLAMGISLAFGLVLQFFRRRKRISRRSHLWRKFQYYILRNPRLPWILAAFICIVLMVLGMVLSLSRGGVLCSVVGLFVFFWLYYLLRSKDIYWQNFLLLLLLPVPLGVYLYLIGMEPMKLRFLELPSQFAGRLQLWTTSWTIFTHHFWLGVGGGCYAYAFEIYKPMQITHFFRYAHNDYLHFLCEYGIVGGSILVVALTAWGYEVIRIYRYSFSRSFFCGIIAAISVIFFHAIFDFSLQIPGHRLLCVILMGCAVSGHRTVPLGAKQV